MTMNLYNVFAGSPEYGADLVLAETGRRARLIAWRHGDAGEFIEEFTDVRALRLRNVQRALRCALGEGSRARVIHESAIRRLAGFVDNPSDDSPCAGCGLFAFYDVQGSIICGRCGMCGECWCRCGVGAVTSAFADDSSR